MPIQRIIPKILRISINIASIFPPLIQDLKPYQLKMHKNKVARTRCLAIGIKAYAKH